MRQLVIIIFVGVISFISLGIIAVTFDPFQAVGYIKFLFFASLFSMVWSAGTITFFYLNRPENNRLESAFRMGLLLALIISGIVFWARLTAD